MKVETVHDAWRVAAEQIELLRKDNRELNRTHEMANMFGKMHNMLRLKVEALKAAKISPSVKNAPEIMSDPT